MCENNVKFVVLLYTLESIIIYLFILIFSRIHYIIYLIIYRHKNIGGISITLASLGIRFSRRISTNVLIGRINKKPHTF